MNNKPMTLVSMRDIMVAIEGIPGAPMLTSNQCSDLAASLNSYALSYLAEVDVAPLGYVFRWDYEHGNGWCRNQVRFVESMEHVAHEDQSTFRGITAVVDHAHVYRLQAELAKAQECIQNIQILAFDPNALAYGDAPGYMADIRDTLESYHNPSQPYPEGRVLINGMDFSHEEILKWREKAIRDAEAMERINGIGGYEHPTIYALSQYNHAGGYAPKMVPRDAMPKPETRVGYVTEEAFIALCQVAGGMLMTLDERYEEMLKLTNEVATRGQTIQDLKAQLSNLWDKSKPVAWQYRIMDKDGGVMFNNGQGGWNECTEARAALYMTTPCRLNDAWRYEVRSLFPGPAQHKGEPVPLTAVGVLREDEEGSLYPEWILEGGTAELWAGAMLLVADEDDELCAEDGHCILHRHPGSEEE